VAGLPVSIVFTNNVSLDSLNHMQLSTGSHCVFNLKAHLIFSSLQTKSYFINDLGKTQRNFCWLASTGSSQVFGVLGRRRSCSSIDLLPSDNLPFKSGT